MACNMVVEIHRAPAGASETPGSHDMGTTENASQLRSMKNTREFDKTTRDLPQEMRRVYATLRMSALKHQIDANRPSSAFNISRQPPSQQRLPGAGSPSFTLPEPPTEEQIVEPISEQQKDREWFPFSGYEDGDPHSIIDSVNSHFRSREEDTGKRTKSPVSANLSEEEEPAVAVENAWASFQASLQRKEHGQLFAREPLTHSDVALQS